jgi:hypothetical protein
MGSSGDHHFEDTTLVLTDWEANDVPLGQNRRIGIFLFRKR